VNKKVIIVGSAAAALLIATAVLGLGGKLLSRAAVENKKENVSAVLNEAKDLEEKNKLVEAKAKYQKLVAEYNNSPDVMAWQKKMEEINMKLLFTAMPAPQSVEYVIKPGDTLIKIAREHNTTPELIMKCNGLADTKIMPGRKLKVWNAPFTIFVDKSQNILLLKTGEEVVKTYVVSTGKDNSSPVGKFKIVNKLTNPTWFKAGAVVAPNSPENILGTRWMGFDLAGYGIHGTTEPQDLGKQVTLGCVRMRNEEVEELYAIVPVGTEVSIVD
jgi:lipoprotein-anchoring transpeptidase ErfK/SrfK